MEPRKHRWQREKREENKLVDPFRLSSPLNKGQFHFSIWYFIIVIVAMIALNALITIPADTFVTYSRFKELVRQEEIGRVEIGPDYLRGFPATAMGSVQGPDPAQDAGRDIDRTGPAAPAPPGERGRPTVYRTTVVDDPGLIPLLEERDVEYYAVGREGSALLGFLLNWLLPLILLLFIWRILFNRMGSMGPDVMSFGRNRSRIVAEGDTGVRFQDVAGIDEAKSELEEVVDFLKSPERYAAIGGRIPKGVLLVGAPGTGKTLLAKAVAGEAAVPFFRMSGADFVEMFVGVGAARVRDLFRQAREKAPCIIFIDELDAIGKVRATGGTGNDEREQTLNQLLVEMDGFDARTGVIILAATNRPEILDPAITRPGRFDRQVLVDRPTLEGREQILRVHAREVKLAPEVSLERVARQTPGLAGADLANIVNEAALVAVRAGRGEVIQEDFDEAIEKVIAGLQRRNRLMDAEERRRVAYHETGHALAAHLTPRADSVQKISIVPRGYGALGYTLQLPSEERYLQTEQDLLARVDVLLAGRAAEEIVFGDISTGAADDLTKASDIVRKMLTDYGMSERFRNVYLPYRKSGRFLEEQGSHGQREYAESTQEYIDGETARIIDQEYTRVRALLEEHREQLETVAHRLLEVENLGGDEFRELVALRE
ncbi:MAG: ATP-dependent zinc metalloprotease FtsH [Spirochaetaceae bacterium]